MPTIISPETRDVTDVTHDIVFSCFSLSQGTVYLLSEMATGLPTGTVFSSAAAILRFGTRCTDFFCKAGARGGKSILEL